MPLPHPHGSASGQIGHNASYDTGITPGSSGGKFIGFGEEGTSAIANRAHWALSENIDYLYDIVAADRALPAGASWTVPGGGASSFQLTGDVFVGDASYPGSAGSSDPEGMALLFSVLDDAYNELQDGSGNEVRVTVVRDSTNTTDVYQGGFENNAVLTFKTVDPVTGADVTNPYTIPAATDVRILYAEKGTLENLPTDSFIRFKVHSGAEAEAGTFLQNGSRAMSGDADWGSYDINNITQLRGPAGTPMLAYSQLNLQLQGATELQLRDQHLSGFVPLSEAGQTEVETSYSRHPSLIGSLNSNSHGLIGLAGNRVINKGGAITFDGASGDVTLPAGMIVSNNGEAIDVGGQVLGASSGVDTYGVIDATGSFVARTVSIGGIAKTDTLVCRFVWDGVSSFTMEVDVRWSVDLASGSNIVTCGDAAGTDFQDLQEAVDAVTIMRYARGVTTGSDDGHGVHSIIRIVGKVTVDDTVTFNSFAGTSARGITIEGDSRQWAKIDTATTFPAASHIFDIANESSVVFRDLQISWLSTSDQDVGKAVFFAPGTNFQADNIYVTDNTNNPRDFIKTDNGLLMGQKLRISKCLVNDHNGSFFDGGAVSETYHAHDVVIENCRIQPETGTTATQIIAYGERIRIEKCVMVSAHSAVACGYDSTISDCVISGTGSGVGTCIYLTHYLGSYAKINIVNNHISYFDLALWSDFGNASVSGHSPNVTFSNNYVRNCNGLLYLDNDGTYITQFSGYYITNNNFHSFSDHGVRCRFTRKAVITGNVFTSGSGTPLRIREGTTAYIAGNYIDGWNADTLGFHAIGVDEASSGRESQEPVIIEGNYIENNNSTATASEAVIIDRRNVHILGNIFKDTPRRYTWIKMTRFFGNRICNNYFWGTNRDSLILDNSHGLTNETGVVVANNRFYGTAQGYSSIVNLGVPRCIFANNYFGNGGRSGGTAIHLRIKDVSSSYYNPNYCAIVGNVIDGVDGKGLGLNNGAFEQYGAVFVDRGDRATLTNPEDFIQGIAIAGNTFYDCGFTNNLNAVCCVINTIDGRYSAITGNTFFQMRGPQNTDVFTAAEYIRVGSYGLAVANAIYHDVEDTNQTTRDQYGITTSSNGCALVGNNVYFVGSKTTGTSNHIAGLTFLASSGNMMVGNMIGDFNVTVTGNKGAINARVANNCLIAVNMARGIPDIDCALGSGMCIGNYVSGAGSTVVGTHATSGNV